MKFFVCKGYSGNTLSCGMFVYTLVTSIETSMALLGSLILSMKLIKSAVSLRYEACSCAIGCIRWSTPIPKTLSVIF